MNKVNHFLKSYGNLNEILKINGKNSTKLSFEIYNLLENNKKPMTANAIHKKIKLKADLSSIYRILKKFLELNLIDEEIIGKESYYFFARDHHHHIICKKCGYIECIPCNTDFSWINNFSNITHSLTLKGVCNECSKTK
jgi:Fe2+ or Zn2+ uptake regulation protein